MSCKKESSPVEKNVLLDQIAFETNPIVKYMVWNRHFFTCLTWWNHISHNSHFGSMVQTLFVTYSVPNFKEYCFLNLITWYYFAIWIMNKIDNGNEEHVNETTTRHRADNRKYLLFSCQRKPYHQFCCTGWIHMQLCLHKYMCLLVQRTFAAMLSNGHLLVYVKCNKKASIVMLSVTPLI